MAAGNPGAALPYEPFCARGDVKKKFRSQSRAKPVLIVKMATKTPFLVTFLARKKLLAHMGPYQQTRLRFVRETPTNLKLQNTRATRYRGKRTLATPSKAGMTSKVSFRLKLVPLHSDSHWFAAIAIVRIEFFTQWDGIPCR